MTGGTAIEAARAQLGLDAQDPATAYEIARLDRPEERYFLVLIGDASGPVTLATIDAVSGTIQSRASVNKPHEIMGAEAAIQRSGFGSNGRARLVWKPCMASRSQLYPLWEVSANGNIVYLDQQGRVWNELEQAGPGA